MDYRNWELGGEVRGGMAVAAGENGVGIRQGFVPNAREIGAVAGAADAGALIFRWEVDQVVNVIEEAAAVYLVNEIWIHISTYKTFAWKSVQKNNQF